MGGCASRPNEADGPNPEAPPAESPATHELTSNIHQGDDTPTETQEVEEPLIDVSTPKVDEDNSPTSGTGEELATGIGELKTETAKPEEDGVTKAEGEVNDEAAKLVTGKEVVDQPLVS
ncbi:uncharacterized protein [Typha latifolia]|uniref:uncharacterized protein n=1 Tax=Typha latifolia TaxID=4733 RepID=UPI003C2DAD3A